MRSERWIVVAAVACGCSYEWDALRFNPDAALDRGPPVDAVADARADRATPDVADVRDVMDAADARDAADGMDVRDAADVSLDAPADLAAEMPADVARDAAPDAVADATPDAMPDAMPDVAPDLPPMCTPMGMTCPCAASNPRGYCRPGEACTGGSCARGTLAGSLVITEIMNTPAMSSATTGEWFEVYNPGSTPLDLRGLRVSDNSTNITVTRSTPVIVGPMSYAVIGRSDNMATNGMVTVLYAYGTSGSVPALADDDRVVLDLGTGETEIDRVVYLAASWPNTRGRAKSLRPSILSASLNDDFSNWCNAPTQWSPPGSDYGSPGAANPPCP